MIKRFSNKDSAVSFAVGCGGFVYEFQGDYFHVPFTCMDEAEKLGMKIADLD